MTRKSPEAALQRSIVDYLTRGVLPPHLGGPAWTARNPLAYKSPIVAKISKGLGMKAGWPDIDMIWESQYLGFELKSLKGRVSEHQRIAHDEIARAGGRVFIIRDLDEFINILAAFHIPTRASKPQQVAA